jgi:hypothetical protein
MPVSKTTRETTLRVSYRHGGAVSVFGITPVDLGARQEGDDNAAPAKTCGKFKLVSRAAAEGDASAEDSAGTALEGIDGRALGDVVEAEGLEAAVETILADFSGVTA